jgi:hypothetical protein
LYQNPWTIQSTADEAAPRPPAPPTRSHPRPLPPAACRRRRAPPRRTLAAVSCTKCGKSPHHYECAVEYLTAFMNGRGGAFKNNSSAVAKYRVGAAAAAACRLQPAACPSQCQPVPACPHAWLALAASLAGSALTCSGSESAHRNVPRSLLVGCRRCSAASGRKYFSKRRQCPAQRALAASRPQQAPAPASHKVRGSKQAGGGQWVAPAAHASRCDCCCCWRWRWRCNYTLRAACL